MRTRDISDILLSPYRHDFEGMSVDSAHRSDLSRREFLAVSAGAAALGHGFPAQTRQGRQRARISPSAPCAMAICSKPCSTTAGGS